MQSVAVANALNDTAEGAVTFSVFVPLQLLLSVTVTELIPAHTLLIVAPVAAVLHK